MRTGMWRRGHAIEISLSGASEHGNVRIPRIAGTLRREAVVLRSENAGRIREVRVYWNGVSRRTDALLEHRRAPRL